jgi:Fe-S-cluster containining protein
VKKPTLIRYQEHEDRYEWLPMLFQAYYQNDLGTYQEMKKLLAKATVKIACEKGCYKCCINQTIPITQIELMGISWFVLEGISDLYVKQQLRSQMSQYKQNKACPFLLNGECGIYPLRPIACREFHVLHKPCASGEDVLLTRPGDIWGPSRAIGRKTAAKLLPFYGFKKPREIEMAFEEGFIHANTQDMHLIDWAEMAKMHEMFNVTSR